MGIFRCYQYSCYGFSLSVVFVYSVQYRQDTQHAQVLLAYFRLHRSATQHRQIESTHMHLFNGDNMIIIIIIVLYPPPFINTSTHKRRNTGVALIFRSRVSCISSTNSGRKECNDSKRIYEDVIVWMVNEWVGTDKLWSLLWKYIYRLDDVCALCMRGTHEFLWSSLYLVCTKQIMSYINEL